MPSLIIDKGFVARPIPDDIFAIINGNTFHENTYIFRNDLSYLNLKYVDFSGNGRHGEMICNNVVAKDLLSIFKILYDTKYPIEKIQLADVYNGADDMIMTDNNTSCFNYRTIADTNVVSKHGYGLAVDINPLYNPYIVGNKIMPAVSAPYSDRELDFSYKIDHSDLCYRVFTYFGWHWGGDWFRTKDYQHFYR